MKKLFYVIAIVLMTTFCCCSKETTYTFTDSNDYSTWNISSRTVYLIEYDANENRIATNNIESWVKGKDYKFTASSRSELVKVYLILQNSGSTLKRWVQQVYYLEEGKNTRIAIDGNTLVAASEP